MKYHAMCQQGGNYHPHKEGTELPSRVCKSAYIGVGTKLDYHTHTQKTKTKQKNPTKTNENTPIKWMTTIAQATSSTPLAENHLQRQQDERKQSPPELHPVCLSIRKIPFITA